MNEKAYWPPGHVEVSHRYGRLVVLGAGSKKTHFKVGCDCGVQKEVNKGNLRSGNTTSCGCYQVEATKAQTHKTTHGMRGHPLYRTWANLRDRCNSSEHKQYGGYGGRGIGICQRWDDFSLFVADMGERPTGYSLDRIDTNGNYEPTNCRWASAQEQRNNRRDSLLYQLEDGELYTFNDLAEVAALAGISYSALNNRLRRGVNPMLACTLPPGSRLTYHPSKPWTEKLYEHA